MLRLLSRAHTHHARTFAREVERKLSQNKLFVRKILSNDTHRRWKRGRLVRTVHTNKRDVESEPAPYH